MKRRKKSTAIQRLKKANPSGPPHVVLILDEESARCLAMGAVNARAQLAATKAIAALEPLTDDKSASERTA